MKDELLQCYLRPYANKLFYTRRPLIYIDCFAGAGTYGGITQIPPINIKADDVSPSLGSPYIALKELTRAAEESTLKRKPFWYAYFIENKYYEQLSEGLRGSQFCNQTFRCIKGDFKCEMPAIIAELDKKFPNSGQGYSLFCYIDPFGIKDLKMSILQKTITPVIKSTELLINFNSFGLLRAAKACLLHDSVEDEIKQGTEELDYELIAEELFPLTQTAKKELFSGIFGCTDWIPIIEENIHGFCDGYETEEKLSRLFKTQLQNVLGFQYVLDIPIRLNDGLHPKYRMVHATNHHDGAALMGDTIRKRKKNLYIKSQGQATLFELPDYEDVEAIKYNIMSIVSSKEIRLPALEAEYYSTIGVTATPIHDLVATLEKEGKLIIRREPEYTENGRKSIFTVESSGHRIFLQKKNVPS